jgi:Zn-dependent metalloprotease
MKKSFLAFSMLTLIVQAYSQNSFRDMIRGDKGLSKHSVRLNANEQIAFNPLQAKNAFSLQGNSDLILSRQQQDKLGFTHYRYYQTYRSIPVENSMYIVHTKNGKITGMDGSIVTDFD